jgi:cytosine/creatinine deaminase
MLIEHILGARVAGHVVPQTLRLGGAHVAELLPPEAASGSPPAAPGASLDAAGHVLSPAFIDAHVHLDKALLLGVAEARGPLEPRLEAAILAVAALRDSVALEQIERNAERVLHRLVRHGVSAARAHVEVDPAVGTRLVELQIALAERWSERVALQLVAFPQRGLELPNMLDLMHAALALGVPVVGGCPYVDRDPRQHLDRVFQLAERYRAPIDLHLDFSDDPDRSLLGLVIERTLAHGLQGNVTIGHVTTLAAMAPDAQGRALDALAAADIALVVLPATDLYLAGAGEPGSRSLAPIERARAAGVRVAIANNNIHNPFSPFGNANLLAAAWLAGITRRAASPEARKGLLDAITHAPAQILGLGAHGPTPGAAAHLCLLDSEDPDQLALEAPAVIATLRAGQLVYRTRAPTLR